MLLVQKHTVYLYADKWPLEACQCYCHLMLSVAARDRHPHHQQQLHTVLSLSCRYLSAYVSLSVAVLPLPAVLL